MPEREDKRTLAELLLGEPEIVARLEDADACDDETDERNASSCAA